MKTCIVLLSLLAAGSVMAGQPKPKPAEHTLKSKTPVLSVATSAELNKPNEIKSKNGRVTYSGVAVQVVKTRNPLQLINPFAPPEYGSGSQNLDRDIITGRDDGRFKLFSISF